MTGHYKTDADETSSEKLNPSVLQMYSKDRQVRRLLSNGLRGVGLINDT